MTISTGNAAGGRPDDEHLQGTLRAAQGGPWPLINDINDVGRARAREGFKGIALVFVRLGRRGNADKLIGGLGGEARHNSQMMVVSKLLNDLVTRRQRAAVTKGI